MKRTLVIGFLALAVAYVAGCGTAARGRTVMKWEKGEAAQTMIAPETGEYALYGFSDTTAKRSVVLKAGEKMGFETGADGLYAIGGEQKFGPYTDRSLFWKKVK